MVPICAAGRIAITDLFAKNNSRRVNSIVLRYYEKKSIVTTVGIHADDPTYNRWHTRDYNKILSHEIHCTRTTLRARLSAARPVLAARGRSAAARVRVDAVLP